MSLTVQQTLEKDDSKPFLSSTQKKILLTVYLLDQGLLVTSMDRPNAGLHSQRRAVDFGHPDRARLFFVFNWLHHTGDNGDKWGLSLGLPPAQIHLHIDDRSGTGLPSATWIETSLPKADGFPDIVLCPLVADGSPRWTIWQSAFDKAREVYK